ncbi:MULTISPECIES: LppU/SCO3897 family protein [Actinopolyspora]|uniref:Uncharacterized protein n=1 Tax=Actinopolyspora saharensis TaxID=995062 RepID=A0A1H1EWI7_9ACTN|nr:MULTISPECIES: hypothetical protein [Actinopolyspora]NHD18257.1 hypothetical protein [Actinopolyspora sp. BKK2]NHE77064.1 hypothetical protein [Actinopolyspora sp. BKK1]SDQ93023.1 hypothetical protein SAMN04489718_2719 [Actinopolyspora saharensis]
MTFPPQPSSGPEQNPTGEARAGAENPPGGPGGPSTPGWDVFGLGWGGPGASWDARAPRARRFRAGAPLLLFSVITPIVLVALVATLVGLGARTDPTGEVFGGTTSEELGSEAGGAEDSEGPCLNIVDPDIETGVQRPATCGSRDSDYEVVRTTTSPPLECPSDAYSRLVREGSGYCMIPDVRKGDCMRIGAPTEFRTKVRCVDAEADLRITKVVSGADETRCPIGTNWYMSYPDPGETLCAQRISAI